MIFADWIYLYIGLGVIAFTIILAIRSKALKKKALREFISPKLLAQLSYNSSKFASQAKFLVLILGLTFAFIALARPQWGVIWQETKSKGTDIIFAIDCSKSMLADDIKPNRLERAKLAIEDSLNFIEGDRLGIVAFSGQAFLQCPLTLDYNAFKMSLDYLNTDLIQRGGTNISAAILEAESAFKASTGAKNIILLSDGEELEEDAIAQATKLAKEGIKIYTIGVGDTKLSPLSYTDNKGTTQYIRDTNGAVVQSKLDEERLVEIANASGAFYGRLDTNAMFRAVEEIQKEKQDLSSKMKQTAIERYQIFLAIAIVLLCLESLIGTRKLFAKKLKNISLNKLSNLLIFALCLVALPKNTQAQSTQTENDSKYYFNLAVQKAENGEIADATKLYKKVLAVEEEDMLLHAKALYNLANIQYKIAEKDYGEIPDISEATTQALSALDSYENAFKQGNEILKEGNYRLINDLANATNNLEEQSFQDALKQSIQGNEAILKTAEEFEKAKDSKLASLSNVKSQLDRTIKAYDSAINLAPNMFKAKQNKDAALTADNLVSSQKDELEKISELTKDTITKAKDTLPKLIEDLKKLLRNDDNQDNQENQDQENQDNQEQSQDQQSQDQQSQDSQSQDQKSQDNQNQDQQSQDNQSQDSKENNSEQSQQSQEQNQQDNQKQDQENQQNKDKENEQAVDNSQEQSQGEEDSQEKEQEESQGEENQAQQKEQSQQGEENPAEQQNQEQGESQDEQAAQSGEDEQAAMQEQSQQAAQEAAQEALEEALAEQQAQDFRVREGAMTKREALQLLESTQGKQKYLPFKGFGENKDRYNQNYKDW